MMNIHAEASDERARALLAGLREKVGALHQRVAELEAETREWQPIETAPKDKNVLLAIPGSAEAQIGRWSDDKYAKKPKPFWDWNWASKSFSRARQPTHWMPLPAPPTGDTK